jgi:hypothetical protein
LSTLVDFKTPLNMRSGSKQSTIGLNIIMVDVQQWIGGSYYLRVFS